MFRNPQPANVIEVCPNMCNESRHQEKLGFYTLCGVPDLSDGLAVTSAWGSEAKGEPGYFGTHCKQHTASELEVISLGCRREDLEFSYNVLVSVKNVF